MRSCSPACEDDDTKSGDLQLFYPTVVDIGPSMNFVSGTPTYYGPAPSNFSIAGITLDDKSVATECFSIGADTGMVSISNTDDLEPGTYKLTIACQAGGGVYRFTDIFVVRMVPAAPEAIEVSEPALVIPYAELETTKASVTVMPVGESVSILGYALVQTEGEEYFAISGKGVVTLNANFSGEIMPGDYPLPIRITTYAGAAVYENLLTGTDHQRTAGNPLSFGFGAYGVQYGFPKSGADAERFSRRGSVGHQKGDSGRGLRDDRQDQDRPCNGCHFG